MSAKAKKPAIVSLLDACLYADWQQVVLNGGPPCFHLDGMTFCLRAERWQGHGIEDFHKFVPLHDLLKQHIYAIVEPLEYLVEQIDKSNAVDDHGHRLKNLHALTTARHCLDGYSTSGLHPETGEPCSPNTSPSPTQPARRKQTIARWKREGKNEPHRVAHYPRKRNSRRYQAI